MIERVTGSPIAWCGAAFFAGVIVGIFSDRLHRMLGNWTVLVAVAGGLTGLFLAVLLPGLTLIGAITYAVYLCHMPVVIAARTFMPQWFANRQFLT